MRNEVVGNNGNYFVTVSKQKKFECFEQTMPSFGGKRRWIPHTINAADSFQARNEPAQLIC